MLQVQVLHTTHSSECSFSKIRRRSEERMDHFQKLPTSENKSTGFLLLTLLLHVALLLVTVSIKIRRRVTTFAPNPKTVNILKEPIFKELRTHETTNPYKPKRAQGKDISRLHVPRLRPYRAAETKPNIS